MRIVALLLLATIAACRHATPYETYVQANRTDTPGDAFILVLVKNPASPQQKLDAATANFKLSQGESDERALKNKYYPGRTYTISASREDAPVLLVVVKIEESGKVLFESTQRFASWVGF